MTDSQTPAPGLTLDRAADPSADDPVFTLTRTFAAPLPRVWSAWTEPALLARWYGPKSATTTILRAELKPGGLLHGRMAVPGAEPFFFRFLYREISPRARLAWVQSFADADGAIAPSPFGEPWPRQLLTEIAFEPILCPGEACPEPGHDSARVTLRWSPLDAGEEERAAFAAETASMTGGWTGSFARLDAVLG